MFHGILSTVLYDMPILMIQALGIAYAIVQWRRHPRLSTLMVVGLGLGLSRMAITDVVLPVLAGAFGRYSLTTYGNRALRISFALVSAASYAIIVFAAFLGPREGIKPVSS